MEAKMFLLRILRAVKRNWCLVLCFLLGYLFFGDIRHDVYYRIIPQKSWSFWEVVQICEKTRVDLGDLGWTLNHKLGEIAEFGVPDDYRYNWDVEKLSRKFRPKYTNETISRSVVKMARIKIMPDKELSGIDNREHGLGNYGFSGDHEKSFQIICYDVIVTPGSKYIQVDESIIDSSGIRISGEWFIPWSGKMNKPLLPFFP